MTHFGSTRTRALGAAVLVAAMAASLAACTSSPGADATPSGGASSAVDQSLRDLLPDSVKSSGVINIAADYSNPPIIYADAKDATKPAGIAYEESVAVGKLLGVTPVWTNTGWPGQLPGLDAGTFDIVWGQPSQSAHREAALYDQIPFYQSAASALVATGNPKGITSWATMCGAKVAVPTGSIQEVWIASANSKFCKPANKPAIAYTEYSNNAATYAALTSGQADAVVDGWPVIKGVSATIPGTAATALSDYAQIDAGFQGITFRKDEAGLTKAVLGALLKLYADGTIDGIFKAADASDEVVPVASVKINVLTGVPVGTKDPSKDPGS